MCYSFSHDSPEAINVRYFCLMNERNKMKAWISAFRLRTLPLSISGIIVGAFFARYNGFWDTQVFVMALLTTLIFQLVSNLANDLGDSLKGTDNAQRIGPTRSVQSGAISAKEMKNAIIIGVVLALISSGALIFSALEFLSLGALVFYVILAILCIVAALLYTIGKKAYGYFGFGDLMVFLFFGCVSVLGVYPLFGGEFTSLLFYPAVTIGLLSTAVLNLNNMRDRQNDQRSSKRTIAVILGPNGSKIYHFALVFIALISHFIFIDQLDHLALNISITPPAIVLGLHVRKVMRTTNPKDFDGQLKIVALSTFALAILTAVGLSIA